MLVLNPCGERYSVTLSKSSVSLLYIGVYVFQTFCKRPHLRLNSFKSSKNITNCYWSFLVVACIHWYLHATYEKTGYKIKTTKQASTAVRLENLECNGWFASIIPDYHRGNLHQKGFDCGIVMLPLCQKCSSLIPLSWQSHWNTDHTY